MTATNKEKDTGLAQYGVPISARIFIGFEEVNFRQKSDNMKQFILAYFVCIVASVGEYASI